MAEHRRPNGSISTGYFCYKCGRPSSMIGHNDCQANAALVKACKDANPITGKPHYNLAYK